MSTYLSTCIVSEEDGLVASALRCPPDLPIRPDDDVQILPLVPIGRDAQVTLAQLQPLHNGKHAELTGHLRARTHVRQSSACGRK